MLGLCPGKDGICAVGHVGGHRLFVLQVQHSVRTREHLRQACAEVCQRHHRAEGTERRQRADQHAAGRHRPGLVQRNADAQHGENGQQDQGVGRTDRHALAVLQSLLLCAQCFAVDRDALGAVRGVLIL